MFKDDDDDGGGGDDDGGCDSVHPVSLHKIHTMTSIIACICVHELKDDVVGMFTWYSIIKYNIRRIFIYCIHMRDIFSGNAAFGKQAWAELSSMPMATDSATSWAVATTSRERCGDLF